MYTQSDISQIYKISDDEIKLLATILGNFHNQYGISSKTTIDYRIIRKVDSKIIGTCTLRFYNDKNDDCLGNIGIKVFDEFNDKDYDYKTIKLLGKIALNFKVKKLNLSTFSNNVRDIELFERLGARFIKIMKIPRRTKLKLSKETLNNLKKEKVKKLVMYNWKIEGDK